MGRLAAAFLAAAAMAPAPGWARPEVVHAARGWAAIDHGGVCEASARSLRIAAKDKAQASAGFAFAADRRRWGEFHARLGRAPRAGSSVLLKVGDQPFLLVARGDWVWSRGRAQDSAIIAAVRHSGGMRIEARDQGGRRFTDHYTLAGAPTAIDAAAARCAGKIVRR